MARIEAWDDEAELKALSSNFRRSQGGRWKLVLASIAGIAAATFVLGWYLPLHKAHSRLGAEHRNLRQKSKTLQSSLQGVQGELGATKAERDRLEGERKKVDDARSAELAQLKAIQAELGTKLEKFTKKGSAAIELGGARLLVGFSDAVLFLPKKAEVAPRGKAALCELAKAAGGAELRLVSVMDADAAAQPLPPEFDSPWALTAARAASAAELLVEKCGVAGANVSAGGRASHEPDATSALAKQLPSRLQIEIVARKP